MERIRKKVTGRWEGGGPKPSFFPRRRPMERSPDSRVPVSARANVRATASPCGPRRVVPLVLPARDRVRAWVADTDVSPVQRLGSSVYLQYGVRGNLLFRSIFRSPRQTTRQTQLATEAWARSARLTRPLAEKPTKVPFYSSAARWSRQI